MLWAFYVRKGQVFVPTMAETAAGYQLEVEPVEVVSADDVEAVAKALAGAMGRGNPIAPTPTRAAFPKPVLLSYAKVRSWSAFMKGTARWGIARERGIFSLFPYIPYVEGGLREDPERREVYPGNMSVEQIAQQAAERAVGKAGGGLVDCRRVTIITEKASSLYAV